MSRLPFSKFSAAGNDFVIFSAEQVDSQILTKNAIRRICDRRNGIGADGILIIDNSENFDFSVEYFNADGSTGSLCGNGARAVTKFWKDNFAPEKKQFNFTFSGESYSSKIVDNDEVIFKMNTPSVIRRNIELSVEGMSIIGDFANTGSPHFVIDFENLNKSADGKYSSQEDLPVVELGRKIRFHDEFNPEGTNVNFVHFFDGKLHIRSYERGVEDETLACGTGAAAAAILLADKFKLNPPVQLLTAGGEMLIVDFLIENQTIKELFLQGPAKQIFTGFYSL